MQYRRQLHKIKALKKSCWSIKDDAEKSYTEMTVSFYDRAFVLQAYLGDNDILKALKNVKE